MHLLWWKHLTCKFVQNSQFIGRAYKGWKIGKKSVILKRLFQGLEYQNIAKHDNGYLLLAVPLTNSTPNFSHLGDTISRGVTAAIGIGFC